MFLQHVPVVHHAESMDEILEDPFDDDLESTFPPQRYCATYYPRPPPAIKLRRESSTERARLYRELVGHEPYRPPPRVQTKATRNNFRVMLSVKHYMPEEIILKVDGHKLMVSGKHYNETDTGYDKSEFERSYSIPDNIDMTTLTSTITPDGVLVIKAIPKKVDDPSLDTGTEEFAVLPADEDSDNFKVTLDVSEYKPSEVAIHVNERCLVVTAERKVEQVDEHGALEHHRRYERKFSLSSEVDADFLSSRYRDGKITIEAPRKKLDNQMRKLEIKEEKE